MYAIEGLMSTSAPSHKAQLTQEWLADNLHDHITPNIWLPNSTDFNLLGYYVWKIIEKNVNEPPPPSTKASLKVAIVQVLSNMNKDHLIQTCK